MSIATTESTTLPTAGRYDIDPTHSSVEFVARHLVAAKVRGRFTSFSGTIQIASQPFDSTASIEIDVASISTGVDDRDGHLRSPDFFDVEQYPTATFASTSVREAGDGSYVLAGDLTIAGATRPVDLELAFAGEVTDPWGNTRAVFSAETQLNREDFGLTWNQPLDTGGPENHHDLGLFGLGPGAPHPEHGHTGLYHLAWQVDTIDELARARTDLRACGAFVGQSSHGATKSVYARDPDGNELEIMWMLPRDQWGDYAEKAVVDPLDLAGELERWSGVVTTT